MAIMVENKIEMRPINTVKPYVRNPRRNDKTVDLLCKIIPKVGFNVPILIDEKGVIIKGHARFKAAIKLGMTEVPCIISHADPEAIKADRIADNKISEFSEWINEELLHELDTIDVGIDMSDLGFPSVKFDDIPTYDDFEPVNTVSDEDRKKLYEEFLAQQAKESAKEVQIVTEKEIEAAVAKQVAVPDKPIEYYKCVCEKCGHVFFVDASALWTQENGLKRK